MLNRLVLLVSGRERALAGLIACATVALCWAAIIAAGDRVKSEDEPDFVAITHSLVFEGTYARADGTLTAYRAPGLVFFLAPFVRLGAGLMELRMANAVLVGLGLMVLFDLVRRNAGPLAGLIAVALVPVWPVVLYAATTLYPQTLAAFLLVVTVWLLDRMRDDGSVRLAALAGLAGGLLILTIPVVLLLTPVFLVWILVCARRRLAQLIACALVVALVLGGWTWRNWQAFEAFVPVGTSSGFNLMAGNTPGARYDTSLEVRFPEYVYEGLTGLNEVEANAFLTEAALAEMQKEPGRVAWLYVSKFLHWFDYSNTLLSDKVVAGGASAIPADTREIILLATWLVVLLPLVARLAMLRQVPMRPVEVLALCLWIAAGLVYALYFTRVRFRLPFDWLIIAGNGIFLGTLLERFRARRSAGGAAVPRP